MDPIVCPPATGVGPSKVDGHDVMAAWWLVHDGTEGGERLGRRHGQEVQPPW